MKFMNRRALMVRKKRIHTVFAEALGEHFLRIELRTEAGTYPSFWIKSLLNHCCIYHVFSLTCVTNLAILKNLFTVIWAEQHPVWVN